MIHQDYHDFFVGDLITIADEYNYAVIYPTSSMILTKPLRNEFRKLPVLNQGEYAAIIGFDYKHSSVNIVSGHAGGWVFLSLIKKVIID